MSTWQIAEQFRTTTIEWVQKAKVGLDRDPTKNIGGLHAKVAEVRGHANSVRDALFNAMTLQIALRRYAAQTEMEYSAALSQATRDRVDDELLKKFRSKEEREQFLRTDFMGVYEAQQMAALHLEEWELFVKMLQIVYYSLNDTRRDIETQTAILKQQMFNGEVQPNKELKEINSLADLFGGAGREILSHVGGAAVLSSGEVLQDGVAIEKEIEI